MTGNPTTADGEAIPTGLVAVVDEAAAEVGGGVHYVLASAVLIEAEEVREVLVDLVSTRMRGFHWHREGPQMRRRMVTLIETHGVVAHVHVRAAARVGQVRVRRELLAGVATVLADEGVGHLIIESRGAREDGRDRAVLLDTFRDAGGVPFTYDWRTKAEPVLWIADAIGGACREFLIGQDAASLRSAGGGDGPRGARLPVERRKSRLPT